MILLDYAWLVALVALAVFLLGAWVGSFLANNEWLLRAKPNQFGRTPYHCRGGFYYVLPEHEFVTEWVRRDYALEDDT